VATAQRIVAQLTRRQIAQRMRRAGEDSVRLAESTSHNELTVRSPERRRNPGSPHIAGNWSATYTGATEFAAGIVEVTLKNPSPAVIFLEYGTDPHEIPPGAGGYLASPTIVRRGMTFQHPGSTKYKGLFRKGINLALRERFPGIKPIPGV
jgi:hypothetical protein